MPEPPAAQTVFIQYTVCLPVFVLYLQILQSAAFSPPLSPPQALHPPSLSLTQTSFPCGRDCELG